MRPARSDRLPTHTLLSTLRRSQANELVVDLGRVRFMDSYGAGDIRRPWRGAGRRVR